ncbi:serine hydrolase domain-containing protein [Luteimonas huabeiensis]|uniref:serine hydrolase domain-containing protein n=1 Tax=Luteimonas huabeiensis TaxID=1244513 RepID=UPI0004BB7D48|nr:serine hydrolase domain-containing protein [Luteimonas huabeiensis]
MDLLTPLLAAAIATAPVPPPVEAPHPQDAALAARVDRVLERAVAEGRIVGAVVVVARDGRIVHARAAGLADREAGRPMTVDTPFRLASMTKPVVSVALMRLVEQGRLRLDDPVTRWLPGFRPRLADGSEPVVALHHLLTHTSGLGYGFQEPEDGPYHRLGVSDGLDHAGIDLDENLQRLARAPLHFAPGTAWRYSLGIDVLGAVIERASGRSLPEAVAQLVTGPLGMLDTGFVAVDPGALAVPYADGAPAPVRMPAEIAVPLPAEIGHAVRFAPDRAADRSAFPSGGGGMVGTAGDFVRLLEAVRSGGGALLRPETVAQMRRDQVGAQAQTQGPGWGFGYGWAVLEDPAAAGTPQHRGTLQWGGAYGHSWFVDPVAGLSVVALTNTAFEGMSGAFPAEVRDAVYGMAP